MKASINLSAKWFFSHGYLFILLLFVTAYISSCKKDQIGKGFLHYRKQTKAVQLSNSAIDLVIKWSDTIDSNTNRINRALNSGNFKTVTLAYNAAGWKVGPLVMNVTGQKLIIPGSGTNPGKLIAIASRFGIKSPLLNIQASGVTVNGYNNGIDTTAGIAQFIMDSVKALSEIDGRYERFGINVGSGTNSVKIKGIQMKNPGGDGIYLLGSSRDSILNITVDGAFRDGITIISGQSIYVGNCVFKNSFSNNSEGSGWCGVDIEPNSPTDVLDSINFTTCTFSGNKGPDININFKNWASRLSPPSTTLLFYYCVATRGSGYGLAISAPMTGVQKTGQIYFQKLKVYNKDNAGVYIYNWIAANAPINFNKITMRDVANNSLLDTPRPFMIYSSSADSTNVPIGNIHFQNSNSITDSISHNYVLGGGAPYFTNIDGTINIIALYSLPPNFKYVSLENLNPNYPTDTLTVTHNPNP